MSADKKYAEADQLEAKASELQRDAAAERLAELRTKPLAGRLIYAAYSRCPCGAGLAYDPAGISGGKPQADEVTDSPFKGPFGGYWDCSAIILDAALPKGEVGSVQHTDKLPFAFYEIKSENQPSAQGATTRP